MRILGGMILAFLTQVASAIILSYAGYQAFPPPLLQLLPFLLAGIVYGLFVRRRPLGVVFPMFPMVALVIWLDTQIDPGVSAGTVVWGVAGLAFSWLAARLLARGKVQPQPAPGAPPAGQPE